MFGLRPDAWAIVLTAAATYSAFASAYFFARPILRAFAVQTAINTLDSATSDDPGIEAARDAALANLKTRLARRMPHDRRWNALGLAFLIGSVLLFTGAVAVQVGTDKAFHPSASSP